MAETVDVQETTIGVGTVIAILLLGYGTFVRESVFGIDAVSLAVGAFGLTFVAVGSLHGAYGRGDFALAHLVAGIGLFLVAFAATALQVFGGYALLLAGGGYIAVTTIRTRDE
ncbi:hypothetical protein CHINAEXTREME_01715 [Halobiforma lacisalsi AJ5]|uniref:Uncharacterized protein n=1 Tax=Natronobacterium lacisalsi AJ5 TaxID=358396 RepID=M0LEY6_NATLA|nr:hypothetical protein [Halobiforma lacisalsi]APW96563.1 hypothetical protein CHINAEXTREME_01715 [Halobiforma lacisalsi AJ5]EMA32157.1 hypothetical protein C445_12621 [Halobiforma lacisalsi AJ5]